MLGDRLYQNLCFKLFWYPYCVVTTHLKCCQHSSVMEEFCVQVFNLQSVKMRKYQHGGRCICVNISLPLDTS